MAIGNINEQQRARMVKGFVWKKEGLVNGQNASGKSGKIQQST
jgi:hypothetical protein